MSAGPDWARRDPDEPRFAGPPTAGVRPDPFPPPPPLPPPPGPFPSPPGPFPSPPGAAPLEPVVDYGPGVQFPVESRDGLALSRLGSAVAIAGGLMAGIGSLFTWATLRLTADGGDSQGFTAEPSSISYNGLSLLEGRVILVLAVVSIALSAAALRPNAHRLLSPALAATGALAVLVMAFAAIGHPVELATLFRSYRQIDAVQVSLPNGVGTWLALIGALLVLGGGLLALMRGTESRGEGQP